MSPIGRASPLRPLNRPRSLRVDAGEDGRPVAVWLSPRRAPVWAGRRVAVEAVLETWRIDDEWWRQLVSRVYYRLLLEDGRTVTTYWDVVRGRWWEQKFL